MMAFDSNTKESIWLCHKVCRAFQRGKCPFTEDECRRAHVSRDMMVINGDILCCYNFIVTKCEQIDPPCIFFHPPEHLRRRIKVLRNDVDVSSSRSSPDASSDLHAMTMPQWMSHQSPYSAGYQPITSFSLSDAAGQQSIMSPYLLSTAGQQRRMSPYLLSTAGQQPTMSPYLLSTAGQQRRMSPYLLSTAGQQRRMSPYLLSTPGQQPIMPPYLLGTTGKQSTMPPDLPDPAVQQPNGLNSNRLY